MAKFLFALILLPGISLCTNVTFHLKTFVIEETEPGSVLINVLPEINHLINLPQSTLNLTEMQVGTVKLAATSDFFDLNERGQLTAKMKFDREQLCDPKYADVANWPVIISAIENQCYFEVDLLINFKKKFETRNLRDSSTKLAKVQILIRDVNDNRPKFKDSPDNSELERRIKENVPVGTKISLPAAVDTDLGQNSELLYSLHPVADKFESTPFVIEMHKETGNPMLVTTKALNRSEKPEYHLNLSVCDSGRSVKLCTWRRIKISVTNALNPMRVSTDGFSVDVTESTATQTLITTVSACVQETNEEPAVFTYKLIRIDPSGNAASPFLLNSSSGRLYLATSLDRERVEQYKIVAAMQRTITNNKTQLAEGLPTYSCTVTVNVVDVNDEKPTMKIQPVVDAESQPEYRPTSNNESNTVLFIAENSVNEAVLASITIADNDAGKNGEVVCYIDERENFGLVRRSDSEYDFVVRHALDYEFANEFLVTVECHDLGPVQLTTHESIKIFVIDQNDNPPRFVLNEDSDTFSTISMIGRHDYRVYLSVQENNQIGSLIYRINLTDADGDPSNWKHSLVQQNNQDAFYVTSTPDAAFLRSAISFDRELVSTYNLTLILLDPTCSCTTNSTISKINFIITITDINDNAPYLVTTNLTVNEHEHVASKTNINPVNIGRLVGVDADEGKNAKLKYLLIGQLPNCETAQLLLQFDGALFLVDGQFDRERQNKCCILAQVQDNGKPKLTSTQEVCINIRDINDNSPQWMMESRVFNISLPQWTFFEDFKPADIVKLHAIDQDAEYNGMIDYVIIGASELGVVRIDGDVLKLQKAPSSLATAKFVNTLVHIEARDRGDPPRLSQITLTLQFQLDNNSNWLQKRAVKMTIQETPSNNNAFIWIGFASLAAVLILSIIFMLHKLRKSSSKKDGHFSESPPPSDSKVPRIDEDKAWNSSEKKSVTDLPALILEQSESIDETYQSDSATEVSNQHSPLSTFPINQMRHKSHQIELLNGHKCSLRYSNTYTHSGLLDNTCVACDREDDFVAQEMLLEADEEARLNWNTSSKCAIRVNTNKSFTLPRNSVQQDDSTATNSNRMSWSMTPSGLTDNLIHSNHVGVSTCRTKSQTGPADYWPHWKTRLVNASNANAHVSPQFKKRPRSPTPHRLMILAKASPDTDTFKTSESKRSFSSAADYDSYSPLTSLHPCKSSASPSNSS